LGAVKKQWELDYHNQHIQEDIDHRLPPGQGTLAIEQEVPKRTPTDATGK